MTASDLGQAINNLALDQPLVFERGGEIPPGGDPDFYVDRERNPTERLITLFLDSLAHDKILLVGHRGTGKSTELNRIAADSQINGKFAVVRVPAGEVLDLNDMSCVDVIFAIAARAFAAAAGAKVRLSGDLLQRLESWRATVEVVKTGSESASVETTARLSAWFLEALGKLQSSHETRKEMRRRMEPRLTELIQIANDILEALRKGLAGRDVLLIVDDTEKGPEVAGRSVFFSGGVSLGQLRCKAVFAFPVDLYASKDFRLIEQNMAGRAFILPNHHVLDQGGREDEQAIGRLRRAAALRLGEELIDQRALKRAILSSGGNIREFFRLLRDAALVARTASRGSIAADDVAEAESEIRAYYARFLGEAHFKALDEVRRNGRAGSEDVFLDVLRCAAVLEYRNAEPWMGIHPLVVPLLEKWRKGAPSPRKAAGKKRGR
ncbi:MAG: hypothetical protein HY748_00545 [Elusimicrobia bacterium]|nr:hypothetical protein [Elusimicrobiota bacterium]